MFTGIRYDECATMAEPVAESHCLLNLTEQRSTRLMALQLSIVFHCQAYPYPKLPTMMSRGLFVLSVALFNTYLRFSFLEISS